MKCIKDIPALKNGSTHICIDQESFIYDALKLLEKHNIGCLLVTYKNKLVGLLSERQYARKVLLTGKSSWSSSVAGIMVKDFPSASPETTLPTCLELFEKSGLQHLPVLDDNKIVGVVSLVDIDKALMRDYVDHIKTLEDYIYDRRS